MWYTVLDTEKNAYQFLLRVTVGVISPAYRHTENEVAKAFNPSVRKQVRWQICFKSNCEPGLTGSI